MDCKIIDMLKTLLENAEAGLIVEINVTFTDLGGTKMEVTEKRGAKEIVH